MSETMLYRFFDKNARLLYVGVSSTGPKRWKEHSKGRTWWHEVSSSTIEHFATRELALAAERTAIIAEKPVYNRQHNSPSAKLANVEMRYFCSHCTLEAPTNRGWMFVDVRTADLIRRGWEEFNYKQQRDAEIESRLACYSVKVLCDLGDSLPTVPHWKVSCGLHACNEFFDKSFNATYSSYWVDLNRIETVTEFLSFFGHVMEKNWFPHTGFSDQIGQGPEHRCFVFPGEKAPKRGMA